MTGDQKMVRIPEFFVEVFHTRGNFSKFEIMNPNSEDMLDPEWVELDVWQLRRQSDSMWLLMYLVELSDLLPEDEGVLRVTRHPELEKDVLDTTYHPSVESWRIDPYKVKEFFNGNE
jgi:hypothetical protein